MRIQAYSAYKGLAYTALRLGLVSDDEYFSMSLRIIDIIARMPVGEEKKIKWN